MSQPFRLILGFGNKARQGKDTAVHGILNYYYEQRQLQAKHGLKATAPIVQRIGFADSLYEVCRNEYGMTEKDAPLLQRIGQERRQLDPLYWIKQAFTKVEPLTEIVLISDMRYRNEAEYIRGLGGYAVNVARRATNGAYYVADDRPANHPSEIELDGYGFDFYLVNSDGHQALLKEQAITLVEYLRGAHS